IPLAVDNLAETADRIRNGDVLAREAGELLRHEERLREEALNAAGAADGQLVLFRQLVDPENRDDVLEVLVTLQHLLDGACDIVVLIADDARIENARRRRQRIDGGRKPR